MVGERLAGNEARQKAEARAQDAVGGAVEESTLIRWGRCVHGGGRAGELWAALVPRVTTQPLFLGLHL